MFLLVALLLVSLASGWTVMVEPASSDKKTSRSTKEVDDDSGPPNKKPKRNNSVAPSINFKPHVSRRNERITLVINEQTACPYIVCGYAKKSGSSQAPFMNTIFKLFKSDPEVYGPLLKIFAVMIRRERMDLDANRPMPSKEGSPYGWQTFITVRMNDDSTPESIGKEQAKQFTQIANEDDEYFIGVNNKFQYLRDDTVNPPHPVNYFVRNLDTITLLKQIYSDKTMTVAKLADNETIMEQFFGSVEEGRHVLDDVTEEQWHEME